MRRTLMLSALIVLGLVSGAWAQATANVAVTGDKYIHQTIAFPVFDTASVDAVVDTTTGESRINDSIWFAFPPFDSPGPWTQMHVNFLCLTKDTATQTGLAFDSITIRLQTRWKSDSVKYWRTIATNTKQPLKAWDSTGTAAARAYQEGSGTGGSGLLTSVPASGAIATAAVAGFGGPYRIPATYRLAVTDVDSTAGDQYRFQILYNAEPDSIKSFCTTHSTSLVHIMERLTAVIRFHLR